MTVTESEIIRDEAERSSLDRAISDLETAIAVSNPGTRRILEMSLAGAKIRVSTLDKKIEEAKVERAAEVLTQAAMAAKLAAKETALNASERETYRGFLEKEYFTKKDFGKLEAFYTHSYDRLSEGGKDEMSKRIDAGIQRGEFQFTDLPGTIQAREAKHRAARSAKNAGEQAEVSKEKEAAVHPSPTAEAMAAKSDDLGSLDLSGIRISDPVGKPSAAAIPNASSSKSSLRSV